MDDRIVTLNMGLGRDSITMLCLLLEGRLRVDGRTLRPSDVDAVVFSDPGREWRHTYRLIPRVHRMCEDAGLRFIILAKPGAEGPKGWRAHIKRVMRAKADGLSTRFAPHWVIKTQSVEERAASGGFHLRPPILADYGSRQTVVSIGKGDCTDNHKIGPIRRLVEALSLEKFGIGNRSWGARVRRGERQPHISLIGIAADEASRLDNGGRSPDYISEAYPLVEMGISKADEAEILEGWGLGHVRKSGCSMCPYQPIGWYWALSVTEPEAWAEVLEYEARSLERNPKMFVMGRKPLAESVAAWRKRNPDATVDAVLEKAYKRCGTAHSDIEDVTINDAAQGQFMLFAA